MKYLWAEDTGAGFHFWKLVNQLFFDDALVVESKESNQGILDALSDLDIKEDNVYYIAFDYVVDNQDIRNKYRMLKSIADKAEGKIIILDMICFEYLILALISWWNGQVPERQIKSKFVKRFYQQLRIIESTCQRLMMRRHYSIWQVLRDTLQNE